MSDIYTILYERVDNFGFGLGENKEVALKFLKSLFSETDAKYYLNLDVEFEGAGTVARRLGKPQQEAEDQLYDMSRRGLIFRERTNGKTSYRANPTVHVFIEFNVTRMNGEQWTDFKNAGKLRGWRTRAWLPLQRTLPLGAHVVAEGELRPEDDPLAIINSKKRFAIANCVCEQSKVGMGSPVGCMFPSERCCYFDDWAEYMVENGDAKWTTKEHILDLLKMCETGDGLVCSTANSRKAEIFCLCCKCCCGNLMTAKFIPGDADKVQGNYRMSQIDGRCKEVCCDFCVTRCPSMALTKGEDGKLNYNADKCIGCGLCVTACPNQANILHIKPEDEVYVPVGETWFDTYNCFTELREKTDNLLYPKFELPKD